MLDGEAYDETGAPKKFSDFAIITCHEIRQVYRLALRQFQEFINSIFKLMKLKITCPTSSCLSKRLSILKIKIPRYKKISNSIDNDSIITIDSTRLKRFGRDEWHQERHKVSAKRSWRKLHIAVDGQHIIHSCELTKRFVSDDHAVNDLLEQIDVDVKQFTADGAYDKNPVYNLLSEKYPGADIVIPPDKDAIYNNNSHTQRNRNLQEIKTFGRMN